MAGRHATVDTFDPVSAEQVHGGGRGADVAVKHQIAAVGTAHGQGRGVDLPHRTVAQATAQAQFIGRRLLTQGDLACTPIGRHGLHNVDVVTRDRDVAVGVGQRGSRVTDGTDVDGAVDQLQCAVGIECEPSCWHTDDARAVFAADGQVADAWQSSQG